MEKELIKERFKLLAPLLNERNLRLYVATEATVLGHGGVSLVSKATGISRPTLQPGAKIFLIRQQMRALQVLSEREYARKVEGGSAPLILTGHSELIWRD